MMQKQILAYKDIVHGGYAVMVCWGTGSDISGIKKYESIDHYETIYDVRKMAEALNGLLEKWGDEDGSEL